MSTSETNSYDELPYDRNFFAFSHPDRMAVVATLYGLAPTPPRCARVLELGCAEGANLISMAQMLPEAQFVGIDLSPRQIADGQDLVETIGLKNVDLRAMSILDVDDAFGRFDYIICHGVYSWVPAEVRDKILAICAHNLTADGIAFVSYNTYPGWHLRGMVREMLEYHVGPFKEPKTRARQARAFLDFLVKAAGDLSSVYARAIEEEAKLLANENDTYLHHEHLDPVNHPVYFHEFVAHASHAGLQYVGPAQFNTRDQHLPPLVSQVLEPLSGDRIRREQYLDFVRNGTFRQSLLCHADRTVRPVPSSEGIRSLRLSALAKPSSPSPAVRSSENEVFVGLYDDELTTSRPLIKAALLELFEVWPRSMTLDELWSRIEVRLDGVLAPGDDIRGLAEALLNLYLSNLLALHANEPPFVYEAGARPLASPLARFQAENGGDVLSARLFTVPLTDFDRLILSRLDGSRDREALVAFMVEQASTGGFGIESEGAPVDDPEQIRQALSLWIDETLRRLANQALLVG